MYQAFLKLSRHTKIALCVAPILIILGWAASDIWAESQAMKPRFYEMKLSKQGCDLVSKNCVLGSGEFELNLYQEGNVTALNSSFPLDTATLFLVDNYDESVVFRMGMKDSPYYWYRETPLSEFVKGTGSQQKIRLIATVKGGRYVGEFITNNTVN